MPPMIEFPLDLPEVRVLKTELKKREIVIPSFSCFHPPSAEGAACGPALRTGRQVRLCLK